MTFREARKRIKQMIADGYRFEVNAVGSLRVYFPPGRNPLVAGLNLVDRLNDTKNPVTTGDSDAKP